MMEEAEIVFESLRQRNIISWTASINGFYQHGDFKKALKQFSMMRESGIEPNEFTFSIVLASCGCVKDFIDGRMFHTQVIKKGMASGVFVGTAIIDMYSGLGEMDEADKQFKQMGGQHLMCHGML
ncbi:putative pentatricopeptide repeat-containing protein [Vitis vinifera]|uniref:Putative pentatricopeptide repeat-containing protein n=1 Tax=Vitis vinifera TaxID=29760 RepID=A0A438FAD9_VITVI|nr:putative pentatricopeptide repeat-containing protein [Vitis vinifera]